MVIIIILNVYISVICLCGTHSIQTMFFLLLLHLLSAFDRVLCHARPLSAHLIGSTSFSHKLHDENVYFVVIDVVVIFIIHLLLLLLAVVVDDESLSLSLPMCNGYELSIGDVHIHCTHNTLLHISSHRSAGTYHRFLPL